MVTEKSGPRDAKEWSMPPRPAGPYGFHQLRQGTPETEEMEG